MASTDSRKRVRIFLSSPGDVAEERRLAAELIDGRLRKDPGIANACNLELVRWDDPEAPTLLDAARVPQASVSWIKGKPSECDIVIVILWSRLGSPFQLDGRQWASGTEWEYEDARGAPKPPHLLLYRRTAKPQIDLDAPDLDAKRVQFETVKSFLARTTGINDYTQPGELVPLIEAHLRALLAKCTAAQSHRPFTSTLLDRFGIAPFAPAAFRAGAERLIASYLGSPECPVPFGGRDTLLRRLDAWLANSSSRRLLLWAPAGRGKSALVVRWLDSTGERWHPIFLPISIRFSTNRPELIYHALAAQLAALLGAELPAASSDPVGHYRGFAIDYLRRIAECDRPLILVVDGLDEAAGWQLDEPLLPATLPPNLRILVSARIQAGDAGAEGWLRRLGWDSLGHEVTAIEVGPLDRAGIADVLGRQPMGELALPTAVDLAGELGRLSGGDPLLVGLYVQELHRWRREGRRVTATTLAELEPGFAPLFRRWIDDQERLWRNVDLPIDPNTVALLLSLLACALGPLRHADLAALCRELRGPTFTLPRDALKPLASFLYGDGVRQGYVLSHPKLGDFLRRDYFADPAILDAACNAFLSWSRKIIHRLDVGAILPADCPSYLLLFYRQHLQAADRPLSEFAALTGNGWRLALEQLEGGPSSFGGDVAGVLEQARSCLLTTCVPYAEALGTALRCGLILASLRSRGTNMPAELLIVAAKKGLLSHQQALYFSRLAGADRFVAVSTRLLGSLAERDRLHVLAEGFGMACTISYEGTRGTALTSLAPHLDEAQLSQALAVACAMDIDSARAELLAGLAPHLAQAQLADALTTAIAIGDDLSRAKALVGLAPHMGGDLLVRALDAVGALRFDRVEVLTGLAPRMSKELLARTLDVARIIDFDGDRVDALAGLAPYLSDDQLADAIAAEVAIVDDSDRAVGLAGLAAHLSEDQVADALGASRAIFNTYTRARVLTRLAPYLSERQLDRALGIASAIELDFHCVDALVGLAPHLSESQLADALDIAITFGDETYRADALVGLAPYLTESQLAKAFRVACALDSRHKRKALTGFAPRLSEDLLAEALRVACALDRGYESAEVLAGLAPHLSERLLPQALDAASMIYDDNYRATALAGLAPRLNEDLLPQALAAAITIGDGYSRAKLLAGLAPHLGEDLHVQVLEAACALDIGYARAEALAGLAPRLGKNLLTQALDAACAIDNPYFQAEALAGLAPHLSEEQLAQALTAAWAMDFDSARAEALARLAPHLSEHDRPQAIAAALAAIPEMWRDFTRAEALAGLAPLLSETQLAEALAAGIAIGEDGARARALAGLAPHLSEEQFARAFDAACAIDNPYSRAHALTGFAARLSEDQLAGALAAALASEFETPRAEALVSFAPHLSEDQLAEAVATARAFGDEFARVEALVGLAPRLSESDRSRALAEALAAALACTDEITRAAVLAGLAPHLNEPQLAQALASARSIGDEPARARALASVAPYLPPSQQDEALSSMVGSVDRLQRADLLGAVTTAVPVIARRGGSAALWDLFRAIRDTSEWYP